MTTPDADAIFNAQRDAYIELLKPLFLPDDPVSNDIVRYFASLLRILGIEDRGWDPCAESRGILNDLNRLMKIEMPAISGQRAFRAHIPRVGLDCDEGKAFIAAFLQIESIARQVWGLQANKALPYDAHYKGLMEVLVDETDRMCGFAIHWPNDSQSEYRRTDAGIDMVNCMLDMKNATIAPFVGLYARSPGAFSPLVEEGAAPQYTPLANGTPPVWPGDGRVP